MRKKVYNRIIKFLSCFILKRDLRKKFREKHLFKSSILSNKGINNQLILFDDDGRPLDKKYLKGLEVYFEGSNNKVEIYGYLDIECFLRIRCSNNNYVKIGKTKNIFQCLHITGMSEGSKIEIADNVSICDLTCVMYDEPELSIFIEKDCMFSHNVIIRPSDGHALIDKNTNRIINKPEPIIFGEHCWIGMHTMFLKGAKVPPNSIVAAGAVYLKSSFTELEPNDGGVFAGVPAKLVKRGIHWERENTYYYEKNNTQ